MVRVDKDSVVLTEEELQEIKQAEYRKGVKYGRTSLANIVKETLNDAPNETT